MMAVQSCNDPGSKDMTEGPLPVLQLWVNRHRSSDSGLLSQKMGDTTSDVKTTTIRILQPSQPVEPL